MSNFCGVGLAKSCITVLKTHFAHNAPGYPWPVIPAWLQASRMVDEVCSSWAMVSFRKCCTVGRETEVSVPLYYGSLYDPQVWFKDN